MYKMVEECHVASPYLRLETNLFLLLLHPDS